MPTSQIFSSFMCAPSNGLEGKGCSHFPRKADPSCVPSPHFYSFIFPGQQASTLQTIFQPTSPKGPLLLGRCPQRRCLIQHQGTAQASPGAAHKIRREGDVPHGVSVSSECLLSDRSGWLGPLVGAHLGHAGQLGCGAGRGHRSITVPGGPSQGQFVPPSAHPRAASAKVIPGKKFCPIFSERHPVTWAPGCLQHCRLL